MKRNMLFGVGAAALACLLGGCRLAVPQGAAGQDTLIIFFPVIVPLPVCTRTGAAPTGRRVRSGGIFSPM